MATVATIDGIEDIIKGIDELSVDGRLLSKNIDTLIRKVLSDARRVVSKAARGSIRNDPRDAYKAVRSTVYKKIFGGNLNILARRKANNFVYVGEPVRTLRPGQRGGNRRKRSERTELIDSYYGNDRGFILRFLNSGTKRRDTRYGNRGSIRARGWFGTAGQQALEQAAGELTKLVERAAAEVWERKS